MERGHTKGRTMTCPRNHGTVQRLDRAVFPILPTGRATGILVEKINYIAIYNYEFMLTLIYTRPNLC